LAVSAAIRFAFLVALCLVPVSVPVAAVTSEIALVEEVSAPVGGVVPFETLTLGQRFSLPAGVRLTIGLLKACAEETITGGDVVMTTDGAKVTGGTVDRHDVPCPPTLKPTKVEAQQIGAVVLRAPARSILAVQSPRLLVPEPGSVTCEEVTGGFLRTIPVVGRGVDLADLGIVLKRGQSYHLIFSGTSASSEITLRIAPDAVPAAPALSRTIRF
jgi:hypothetical protein